MLLQDLANELQVWIDQGGPYRVGADETLCLDGMTHGVGMHAHFPGDGADFPMLGVKTTANLGTNFRTNHELLHLRRGMRGNGSMKQPMRPQIRQHNHTPGRVSGQRGRTAAPDPSETPVGVASAGPHWNDAEQAIKREP